MATSPEKWEAVKALFEAALELDSSARSAFLRNNCPDAEARAEVERLLSEHDQAEGFLSTPALGNFSLEAEAQSPPEKLSAGEVLAGRFRIVRFIAGGGMGEVYEAEDQELRERVAVKIIRPEILTQPNAVTRFKREVHLARKVTHPNVCRIFDLFRHKPDGRSAREEIVFVSMELLQGETLSARAKQMEAFAHAIFADSLLERGKLDEAQWEIRQAQAQLVWDEDFEIALFVSLTAARVEAAANHYSPAAVASATNSLEDLARRAQAAGFYRYQIEVRLALGEIEMKSGKTGLGRARLVALEKEARAKGFVRIARRAADFRNGLQD
jgi:hypothetical protein